MNDTSVRAVASHPAQLSIIQLSVSLFRDSDSMAANKDTD